MADVLTWHSECQNNGYLPGSSAACGCSVVNYYETFKLGFALV
jgi:hypothetical protein